MLKVVNINKSTKGDVLISVLFAFVVGVIVGYSILAFSGQGLSSLSGQATGPSVTKTCNGNVANVNTITTSSVDCSQKGLVCDNGTCVKQAPKCTDSDNGKNFTKRGTACVGSACKTDVCAFASQSVTEFLCGTDKNGAPVILNSTATCKSVALKRTFTGYPCDNGACKP